MKFVLYGEPRTKKNSQQIATAGRPRVIQSKPYRVYETSCLGQIRDMGLEQVEGAVNLRCVYFMGTRRRVDLVNLIQATQDILVRAGVLPDDNSRIVESLDGCRVSYDKGNPRAEIEITQKQA